MRKEILEQPEAAERVLRGRLDERFGTAHLGGLNMDARDTRAIRRVKVLGCGSAYYVGQMGAALIEELARIPADAEAASEFRYRNPIIEPDTLYVAVSQSGETIDTLLAVQEIRRKGGRVIGLVNVVGSAIARECDGGIYLHAGPGGRGRVDQGADQHVRRVRAARAAARAGPRPVHRRRQAADLRAAGAARPDRRDPRARGRAGRGRGPAGRGREPVLRRPGAGLPGRARGRAEVQGDLLPARRGLPDLRAQARPAGADLSRRADGRGRARRRAHRPQRRCPARDRGPARPAGRGHPQGRRPRRRRGRPDRRTSATSGSSTRSCSPCRCSCWPTTPLGTSVTTSTSPATWRSRVTVE